MGGREWLRYIRKTKQLTLREVAKETGVSIASYSAYEEGKRRPRPEAAKRIAEFLGFEWARFYE